MVNNLPVLKKKKS